MKQILAYFSFNKKGKVTESTKFSRFFHEASSAERKKVFLRVAKKATLDQQKIMNI